MVQSTYTCAPVRNGLPSQPKLDAFHTHAPTRPFGPRLEAHLHWRESGATGAGRPTPHPECRDSGHVSAFQRMTRASIRLSTRNNNMTTAMMRHTTPISSDALYEL